MTSNIIRAIRQPIALAMLGGGVVTGTLITFLLFGLNEEQMSVDPNLKYHDVQLRKGMTFDELKTRFGEPDTTPDDCWVKEMNPWGVCEEYNSHSAKSRLYNYHYSRLQYGAFGAHDQKRGHVTKYRLTLDFIDGKLIRWYKSSPTGEG